MAERDKGRRGSLCADLDDGARALGEPAPRPEDVARLAGLLRTEMGEEAIPPDLVPSLQAALAEAARPAAVSARTAPGLRALLRLLWAEARFLPLSFFACQAALLAMALVANRCLTGFAGPAAAPLAPLMPAIVRDALGRSVDAFTLIAPWLGLAVALFAALPVRRGLWADLEALSPLSGPTRLLARAAVATCIATVGMAIAGLVQMGPTPSPLLLLARTAPLFLAVAWALAWSIPCGAAGAVGASLALWGWLSLCGGRLGRWDLLAPPVGGPQAQLLALAASAALLVAAWALAGRRPVPSGGRQGRYGP